MRDAMKAILCDPQTSGGLLVAVPREKLSQFLSKVENATEIGEVLQREGSAVAVDCA
jgi:selenophosphate synthase